jgi:mono/diheme cytochrome c family protein
MKRILRNSFAILSIGLTVVLLLAMIPQDQKAGAAWVVPAKYKAMKNTQKADPAALSTGKMLYMKHCKSCHGGAGLGDGPKANSMKTKVNSFKESKFQGQTDGEIYFESFVGRDEMPNFEKKIADDEERWAIVSFIRTLK